MTAVYVVWKHLYEDVAEVVGRKAYVKRVDAEVAMKAAEAEHYALPYTDRANYEWIIVELKVVA